MVTASKHKGVSSKASVKQLSQAMALLDEQDAASAEAAFRALLADAPRSSLALQGLGRALYDQHQFLEAEQVFEQAIDVEEVPALARYHMGLCRLAQGDFGPLGNSDWMFRPLMYRGLLSACGRASRWEIGVCLSLTSKALATPRP